MRAATSGGAAVVNAIAKSSAVAPAGSFTTPPWRRLLITCLIAFLGPFIIALPQVSPARALDKVSLQLKWKHQFQFAGYYAAVEKGYYREQGLEVEIREGGPTIDAGATVAAGGADFGVCTTGALLDSNKRANAVVLAVIFQHTAAIILAPYRAGIRTVSELKGHRLMDRPGNDDLVAMLKYEGVDYASLPRVDHDGNPRDLLNGNADAMVAYSTNEPYALDKLGTPYLVFSPRASGLDFYGDNLCTSRQQVAARPERVRAFRAASLKGWQYALAHKEEIVDLIRRRYAEQKTGEALLFEAKQTELFVEPNLIPIGSQSTERWKDIANAYVKLGMLSEAELPAGMIYLPDDAGLLNGLAFAPLAWAVLALLVLCGLGWLLYRRRGRALGPLGLNTVMSGLFVLLSIPVLVFILLYNYHQNAAAIRATLKDEVSKTKQVSIEEAENLINPVVSTLAQLASIAAQDPDAFKREESRDLLYHALTSARQIDAAYVSFEDGFHRVVTRMDDDRRRSDPKIPSSANWHTSYIDSFAGNLRRVRHRTFFDTWPHVVGSYDVPTVEDIRTLRGYQAAKVARTLIIEQPALNPDTGYPVIFVRYPIIRNGAFIGCASANITLDIISRFLTSHRASPRSTTLIANPNNGMIIAFPDQKKGVHILNGHLEIAKLDDIADDNVREAYRLQSATNRDDFFFRSPQNGEEVSASFARFPGSFGQPWQFVILTPTSDFVGNLERTNRQMIFLIAALTGIELMLIYFFSRRLSRPIEGISRGLRSIEDLSFTHAVPATSNITEIKDLQTAVRLFETSLRSFSSFVPLDVVRELIKTGIPLTLGVEQRFMTILFADLKDFSTLAEHMAPNDLLSQLSVYFEAVSQAIAEEHGTVDKFIGDGIMAFWGAPARRPDHALRACRGALRATRRMREINEAWNAAGRPPLTLRIGLHCADVLVGNVGSSERLSYTVMGDGVNVAARLEGINKNFGTTICISDSISEAAGGDIVARPIKTVQVKGRKHEFMVYELLGIRNTDDPQLAPPDGFERLCEMTRVASSYFEQRDFDEAARRYEEMLIAFPLDPLAKSLLSMCRAAATA
ncbi:ABC transporter substrate-binding protein [Bradyrhizobium sp. AS23.2]|uniref:ABC transporter substrate-binding protein n=1 Tax=Bradyrhizobium sp. AS23.2 TaxID=1680155 RepID=UPI0009F94578|nr:ABC transporter substrate-binding protein [Bradyrhizobium sp. AS23.2]